MNDSFLNILKKDQVFFDTWVGKLTNLSASYWHQELMMLEKEQ